MTQLGIITRAQSLRTQGKPSWLFYTHRNLFEILLNQTEVRLHLPFSDWFGAANGRVRLIPNQSEIGKYNLISVWFNKISKIFLCVYTQTIWSRKQLLQTGHWYPCRLTLLQGCFRKDRELFLHLRKCANFQGHQILVKN